MLCVVKHRENLDIFHCLVQHDMPHHGHLIIWCLSQSLTDANWCSPRHVTVCASTVTCHSRVQKLPSITAKARGAGISTLNCVVGIIA
jgi:hypothetical protein